VNNLLFDFSSGVQVRSLVEGLGDEVPQLKAVTSKLYTFLVVIHTQYRYMKSKH